MTLNARKGTMDTREPMTNEERANTIRRLNEAAACLHDATARTASAPHKTSGLDIENMWEWAKDAHKLAAKLRNAQF